MLTVPQPLDWELQSYMDRSVIWHPRVYKNFSESPEFATHSRSQSLHWYSLPFEEAQLEKFPQREGIYLVIHRYMCLDSLHHDLILYLGEATDLRARVRQHWKTAQQPTDDSLLRNAGRHADRLKLLFEVFDPLAIQYCTLEASQDERRQLERQLIGLFDPPFNVRHRPTPQGEPLLKLVGRIAAHPGTPQPAFSDTDR